MVLDKKQLERILPHRDPFLLLTEITDYELGKWAEGYWQLKGDEYFFQGHFPGNPILPGVLMVESLSQAGAVLVLGQEEHQGRTAYFAALDDVRFKHKVYPGDRLDLHITLDGLLRRGFGRGYGEAYVDGQLACRAELTFSVSD